MFWLSGYFEWNQKHVSSCNWEWGANIGRMKKNKKRRQNCLGEWKGEYISKWDQVIQKFPSCFAISEFIFISLSLKTALAELYGYTSDQIRPVAQSRQTLWDPMNHSTPGLPAHHQLLEFTQTHVHQVSDAIQPSHPLSSPSPPAPNPSQHQNLFQWINSSHEVAKVLEFQL